ncbi:MAG: leucyl/phenylalanyl-tRNA--protein transferase [Pseudomonadota bacterium]
MPHILTTDSPFPPAHQALQRPNGLLAVGGDLSEERLLDAYRQGIFPWFNPGEPILWWSPNPRMVLMPPEFKISRSLGKVLRNTPYQIRTDSAFERVMRACAAPRNGQAGTWISADMIAAYCALHQAGAAHSVEVWQSGRLLGGLYGISLGRMFYGESMFSHADNASKIALAHLSRQLQRWQFGMIDCQMSTPHLATLGARTLPREDFLARVKELVNYPSIHAWQFDDDLFP